VSVYTTDANSRAAAKLLSGLRETLTITALSELEIVNALQLRRLRNEITVPEQRAAEQLFGQDLAEGALSLKYFPIAVFQTGLHLSRKHTAELGVRTLDVLHVACAMSLNCETFLSFDQRQRKLAEAEGLRVLPR
jgi:predicted nucleic acid-binding protein